MAAISDSSTSDKTEGGTAGFVVIPLPRTRNSRSPSAWLIFAQVCRLTTIDLSFVRSPSSWSGNCVKQLLADHEAEHGVAEKLEPLVRRQPVVGPRGVRQGRFEQLEITKVITEPLLAALQADEIVGIGGRAWRLDHGSLLDFTRRRTIETQRPLNV